MTCSVGDSGVRVRFFLLLLDGHVVGVEAGEDEERDEEVKDVVYVDSSKAMLVSSLLRRSAERFYSGPFLLRFIMDDSGLAVSVALEIIALILMAEHHSNKL